MELLIVVGAVVALVAVLYVFVYFIVAPWEARRSGITDADKLASFKDSLIKTLAQLIGGLAVVGTFVWTIINGALTLQQTAIQSANQQFINASIQSANTSPELSAAGNYALEKLVRAYPDYCPTVASILTAQIMTRSLAANSAAGTQKPRVPVNIAAAVAMLGLIPRCSGAIALKDGYLAGANFGGSQSYQGSDLRNTKLWGAYLGWATLDDTQFDGAAMADVDAFGGGEADWQKAINDPNWQYDKYNYIVNFENSSLQSAHFLNTSVSGASFHGANLLKASFYNTNLSRADFTGAQSVETMVLNQACYNGEHERPLGLRRSLLEVAKVRDHC